MRIADDLDDATMSGMTGLSRWAAGRAGVILAGVGCLAVAIARSAVPDNFEPMDRLEPPVLLSALAPMTATAGVLLSVFHRPRSDAALALTVALVALSLCGALLVLLSVAGLPQGD